MFRSVLAAVGIALAGPAAAGQATVAVAANFLTTARDLARAFEAGTGHEVVLAHGSTGRLYAQIAAGAPYDVFLSADAERPARLLAEGRAERTATYAKGRLVLVMRGAVPDPAALSGALAGRRVAIADAAVAPYGVAAEEVFAATGLDRGATLVIRADSVGQAASAFATGNADAALLAASQLPSLPAGSWEALPLDPFHGPILQDAALLARGAGNPAAVAFFDFLGSDAARSIIVAAGYAVAP